jgi:hypothetical protein
LCSLCSDAHRLLAACYALHHVCCPSGCTVGVTAVPPHYPSAVVASAVAGFELPFCTAAVAACRTLGGWRTLLAGTTATPATAAGCQASTAQHRCSTSSTRCAPGPSPAAMFAVAIYLRHNTMPCNCTQVMLNQQYQVRCWTVCICIPFVAQYHAMQTAFRQCSTSSTRCATPSCTVVAAAAAPTRAIFCVYVPGETATPAC